jgi:hypothetical protein
MTEGKMSDYIETGYPEQPEWQVETLRATAFPTGIPRMQMGWWDKLIAESPEIRISRPREGVHREEGPFENGKLIFSAKPTRIDWLYTVDIEKSEGLPTLGNFHGVEHGFFKVVKRWLEICDPIKRLAFGAILLYPVSSREEGYQLIGKMLPCVVLDPATSFDFLYQINRPRLSQSISPTILINRLTKWSVAKLQRLHIELSVEAKVQPSILPHEGFYACRLEIDVNTPQQNVDQLTKDKLVPLFDELLSLANEISQKGDIK